MQVYYSQDILEEELKNRVAEEWFTDFDSKAIIGKIDFCVAQKTPNNQKTRSLQNTQLNDVLYSFLWAEAKAGIKHDLYHSLVQLILTIGKARTFDKYLPPLYLGAFDAAEIAFLPYHNIQHVFYQNDFNWNVTPSDHNSKEFLLLLKLVEKTLKDNALVFNFAEDTKALKNFIRNNLNSQNSPTVQKHQINKNNFTFVYQRWCEEVKNSIQIDWEKVKKAGLLDADFFLADLLSDKGESILQNLYVLLKSDHYQFARNLDEYGLFTSKEARFRDKMEAHVRFWNKYERPPKQEYWDYIVERRDLLVPQDVRERKGSFFTPVQWVELSQQYLADTLGESWQDEYYIWDCCAGTGNLLNGLTNKRNIWASTLDQADVDVMHERIKHGANLFEDHVFQFDFLNDEFLPHVPNTPSSPNAPTPLNSPNTPSTPNTLNSPNTLNTPSSPIGKLPPELYDIISDPEKRKKLVIYINPPYAEAGTATQVSGTGTNKAKVATDNNTYLKYKTLIGKASNELFAQFFIRIYKEIPGCVLAEFSTLKILQASNFAVFREVFQSRLMKAFAVPANTFDNVKGQFPIGFMIWDTSGKMGTSSKEAPPFKGAIYYINFYNHKGEFLIEKLLLDYNNVKTLSNFGKIKLNSDSNKKIGHFAARGNDFQNQNKVFIDNQPNETIKGGGVHIYIYKKNLHEVSISFAVRHCIPATWLNDRDQFLYPNDGWKSDREFQCNCLVFALFHNQNRISISVTGCVNHWIPFYEEEVGLTRSMSSHFMQDFLRDFLAGKQPETDNQSAPNTLINPSLPITPNNPITPITLSSEAKAVLDVGREVYRYYHKTWQERGGGSPDASLYDIKEYFKGRNENGKMNNKSDDPVFNDLMETLRLAMQNLAEVIEPKVYEYGFLK